ncbi:MAG TPA: SRPBCC family protein [Acidobacteriota bacterium]|jgi:hypothetical protein|nr:SRPBCC family protein [Acidobacteriota bacterium]
MQKFVPLRLAKRFVFQIDAPASRVFPLLCPVKEYDWIDGWKCSMVYSESGHAEDKCVFTIDVDNGRREICTVSLYEPERFLIHYIFLLPDSHVEKLELTVEDHGGGGSNLRWTRTYTGLSDAGNAFVRRYVDEVLPARMRYLEQAMNQYLRTGEKLARQLQ